MYIEVVKRAVERFFKKVAKLNNLDKKSKIGYQHKKYEMYKNVSIKSPFNPFSYGRIS